MNKLVVLRLDGDGEQHGFRAILTIGEEENSAYGRGGVSPQIEIPGFLPPNPGLFAQLQQHWQEKYRNLVAPPYRALRPKTVTVTGSLKQRVQDCKESADKLSQRFNYWLKSEQFAKIREQLLGDLSRDETIRFLIRTEDLTLQKLPWQEWDLIQEHYPKAEVALSSTRRTYNPPPLRGNHQVKILAILGHSQGINVEEDRQMLESLPNAKITFLVEPIRQTINNELWEQEWDILFFAGHSETEGETGRIYINSQDSLTIDELWYGLRKAVDRGLKLAIFNSCDGLGLAQRLNDLQIPQMIFMRELVPDLVAQTFLKYFLRAFSAGASFYLAVREARERLQGLEGEFPCATWLPVIYQDLEAGLLTWDDLLGIVRQPPPPKRSLLAAFCVIVGAALFVILVRQLGWLQPIELKAFDWLMRSRPLEKPDDRLLLVEVTPEDVNKYQQNEGESLPDDKLEQLIENLNQDSPRIVGSLIERQFEINSDHQRLIKRLETDDKLITRCFIGGKEGGIKPSPHIPAERQTAQVGFSDVIVDTDKSTRRSLLGRTAERENEYCPTYSSFALLVALHYLDREGIGYEMTETSPLKIGETLFHPLISNTGGYQTIDDRGYQIMLNYRSLGNHPNDIANRVTAAQVIEGNVEPNWVKDKIVLIGVTDTLRFSQHERNTPYGKMPGVVLQAHIIGQILSAVKDERPLLVGVSSVVGNLWVLIGSIGGGLLVWRVRSLGFIALLVGAELGVLWACCYGLLIAGVWIPLMPAALALIIAAGGTLVVYQVPQIRNRLSSLNTR